MLKSITATRLWPAIPPWLTQIVRFGLVGILNTAVDIGLYLALTAWTGLAAWPEVAKAISYAAGILNSYAWNRAWTFRSQAGAGRTLLPFVLVNLLGLALNAAVLHVATSPFGLAEPAGLALATAAAFAWNYLASRWIVFRAPAGRKAISAVAAS